MKKTITLTFDSEDAILVDIDTDEEGTPCVSPGTLLTVLVRTLAVLTIVSSKQLKEAYYSASHVSSLVAEAIRDAVENHYHVNIRLKGQTPGDLN